MYLQFSQLSLFFFNYTASTEIYTLSLPDALPIFHHAGPRRAGLHGGALRRDGAGGGRAAVREGPRALPRRRARGRADADRDRKSTRLNSSHANISYADFCLKKKRESHYNKDYKKR